MTEPTIEEIAEKATNSICEKFDLPINDTHDSHRIIESSESEFIKDAILSTIREATEAQRQEIEALERSNQALRGVNTSRKEYGERLMKVLKRIRDYAKETSVIASMVDDALPQEKT